MLARNNAGNIHLSEGPTTLGEREHEPTIHKLFDVLKLIPYAGGRGPKGATSKT